MKRIMLVDDEPDVILLIKKILEKNGYEVVEVNSGKECLDTVEEIRPDLILLDIMMPDLNGWEVSRSLKSKEGTKDVPVVMLTVRASDDSVEKSFEYAFADAHVGKPASTKKMLTAIESVLNKVEAAG